MLCVACVTAVTGGDCRLLHMTTGAITRSLSLLQWPCYIGFCIVVIHRCGCKLMIHRKDKLTDSLLGGSITSDSLGKSQSYIPGHNIVTILYIPHVPR